MCNFSTRGIARHVTVLSSMVIVEQAYVHNRPDDDRVRISVGWGFNDPKGPPNKDPPQDSPGSEINLLAIDPLKGGSYKVPFSS